MVLSQILLKGILFNLNIITELLKGSHMNLLLLKISSKMVKKFYIENFCENMLFLAQNGLLATF